VAPVMNDAVHLPGLGRLRLGRHQGSGLSPACVVVSVAGDDVTIQASPECWVLSRSDLLNRTPRSFSRRPEHAAAEWEPVRVLTAPGLSVTLEDCDPYRDCHQHPAAPRLTTAGYRAWQQQFGTAWQQIVRDHREYASAIAASLTTIMPLQAGPEGRDVSAAARDAFGAIGVALPGDSSTLALLIMHEFQHVKLGAILDEFDLCDPADQRLFHAPWRTDLRPLEGLLQGTYAHLAVTDYWRQQADHAGATAHAAEEFTRWRDHTTKAIDTLAESGSLTKLGERFVAQMKQRHAIHV
jgi:uncharacterized protein